MFENKRILIFDIIQSRSNIKVTIIIKRWMINNILE